MVIVRSPRCAAVSRSSTAARSALEARGYLIRTFNQSRSLELSQKYFNERPGGRPASASFEVPLAGRIAAGTPVETYEGSETLNFADFVGAGDTFALQVRGESMIDDHICEGDFVLVEKANQARNGAIVVALVGGMETTLKRFYAEAEGIAHVLVNGTEIVRGKQSTGALPGTVMRSGRDTETVTAR